MKLTQRDLDLALIWQMAFLTGDGTLYMFHACKDAISLADHGFVDELVNLPDQVSWMGYGQAPASVIIESHGLEIFLSGEELQ